MAGLIIGHTDHHSVKIWIQGDRAYSRARVTVRPADAVDDSSTRHYVTRLKKSTDYTEVLQFNELAPGCEYLLKAEFKFLPWPRRSRKLSGRFKTFPDPRQRIDNFSFVLGSCNLSTVKVNNLLGLVAGLLGQRATDQSLKRKPEGRLKWLRTGWRQVLRLANFLLSVAVNVDTGYRQTGTPLLSSPFLRLSELFDNCNVHFEEGRNEPPPGCRILFLDNPGNNKSGAKASGTLLRASVLDGQWERRSGPRASGFLKLSDIEGNFVPGKRLSFVTREDWTMDPADEGQRPLGLCVRVTDFGVYFSEGEFKPPPLARVTQAETGASGVLIDLKGGQGGWKSNPRPLAIGTLVLTDLQGRFNSSDRMVFEDPDHQDELNDVGTVAVGHSDPPGFMIHAGDQIYFDFPFAHRRPTLEEYRRCYKQSWFEDDWAQSLFGRCPHYMAIDDHEIVDNYASDFEPRQPKSGFRSPSIVVKLMRFFRGPEPRRTPLLYSNHALQAYHEYVNGRHPDTSAEKLYYEFEYGEIPFFVMDTRTERYLHPDPDNAAPDDPEHPRPRMISGEQFKAFEGWLDNIIKKGHKDKLKFVVSSVPFVAQVRDTSDEGRVYKRNRSYEPSLDKWSGAPFNRQRERIIDLLNEKEIQNLVFLAGDVHCCYHATMRIGHPRVTSTIHELASGPIYQLRTGNRSHFFNIFEGRTDEGCDYRCQIEQLHGGASAAMSIRVNQGGELPKIDWEVIRTIPRTISKPDIPAAQISGSIIFEGGKKTSEAI